MDMSRLKRKVLQMPDDVRNLLESKGLINRYKMRPAYQQNDYIGWINRAKRPETREKRINQMLQELSSGKLYMGMSYNADR